MSISREHVVWAYRLFFDRDPENEDVIGPKMAGSNDTSDLRRILMTSAEFQLKNRDYAHTNDRTVVIKELDGGGRLFVDLSDHAIGLQIVRGRYEADEVQFARRHLRPGDTAIDVGAHIGFFTMTMAAAVGAEGRVYAFEPFDQNADLLERSIRENRFEGRVVFERAAVGAADTNGILTFPAETLNSGGAYLLHEGTPALPGNERRTVRVVSLDRCTIRGPVRLIKMDVEGAEPQVLRGAAQLLRRERPVILSELHPVQLDRASGMTPAQFVDEAAGYGYRVENLHGQSIDARSVQDPISILLKPR